MACRKILVTCIALAMCIHALDSSIQSLDMESDLDVDSEKVGFGEFDDFALFGTGGSTFSLMMEEGELGEAAGTIIGQTPSGMVGSLITAGIMDLNMKDGILVDSVDPSSVCVPDLNSLMVEEDGFSTLLPDFMGLRSNLCNRYSNRTRPPCCATECTVSLCWNGFTSAGDGSNGNGNGNGNGKGNGKGKGDGNGRRRRKDGGESRKDEGESVGESSDDSRRRRKSFIVYDEAQSAKSKGELKSKGKHTVFAEKRLFIVDPTTSIEYKVMTNITATTRKAVACLSPSAGGGTDGGKCTTARECVASPLVPISVKALCTRQQRLNKTCNPADSTVTAWGEFDRRSVKARLTRQLSDRRSVLLTMLCAAA